MIDWTMRAHGVSFRHAVESLKAEPLLVAAGNTEVSRVRKLETAVDTSVDDARVLERVVGYDHEGLHSAEAITRFRLGFANRTLGPRSPLSDRVAGASMRGRLQALGVLRESGHEHFYRWAAGGHAAPSVSAGAVWNEAILVGSSEINLCESLIDALTFWRAGFRNVTAAYG